MGGTSEMGDVLSRELPTHTVAVSSFYLNKYVITQGEWVAIMGSNPSEQSTGIGDDLPVNNVSWDDYQKFITKINEMTGYSFRMPTEAEWEFAARGGNYSHGYRYAGSNTLEDVAWYGVSDGEVHPIGLKQPNELGLYDMTGNVWECTNDWFGDYSSAAQINPTGPTSGSTKVYRGGCVGTNDKLTRISFRYKRLDGGVNMVGLRLAMSK